MGIIELIELSAATWYLSYTITNSSGPFKMFERLRKHISLGGLTACIICLAFWVALVLRFIGPNPITDGLAVAGVALWAHSYFGWRINMER